MLKYNMYHKSAPRYLPQGYSMIELLIFISMLMVLTTIVHTAFSGLNPRMKEIIHARNANTIVATANNALIAGAAFKTDTRNEMVAEVIQGMQPSRGIFKGKTFVVPNLQMADLEDAALKYISLRTDGTLAFDSAGEQSAK